MTFSEAVTYGVVQGLAEFLPISSSAHLAILHWLQGNPEKDLELSFDVALHVGTLVPVILYFWKDWVRLVKGFFTGLSEKNLMGNPDSKLLIFLMAATVPGAIIGKLFEEKAESAFRAPWLIATMMLLMGAVLYYADRKVTNKVHLNSMSWKEALLIGFSQALAVIPGVSRSGVTMTMGLLCKMDRESTARFSFLLSAPIIAGAAIVKVPKLLHSGVDSSLLIAVITAGIVGWAAIVGLLKYVQKHNFIPFVVYRFLFAIVVFGLFFLRG